MAHLIDMSTGRAGMAYRGMEPWHGLGQRIDHDATIDEWRIAAGANFHVMSAVPMYQNGLVPGMVPIPEQRVLYRDDTGARLSTVSDSYQVVQPREVFEFFRDLTEMYGFQMETAGVLKGGNKIWALATMGDGFSIMGTDTILPYLMLATSFDGSMATQVRPITTRVVCQNTLNIALGENRTGSITVNHSSKFDERKVKQELGLIEAGWGIFEHTANELAHREISPKEALDFMLKVTGTKVREGEQLSDKKFRTLHKLIDITQNGVGQNIRSANKTAWGLVNGVTRWVDHEKQARSNENRLNSAWFGAGDRLKDVALKEAVKLLNAA